MPIALIQLLSIKSKPLWKRSPERLYYIPVPKMLQRVVINMQKQEKYFLAAGGLNRRVFV